ncbi:MAG: hypothetical protein NDJ89_15910 [Oligoflexia bacterium]|nr:hypothetical protein [Oligoflexia bacterium]
MKVPMMMTLVLGLALAACQRSPAYKRDQDYYRGDSGSYYSNPQGKSPTQRVESLGQPKKRVLVLNFWNDTPVKIGDLGAFGADELRRGLHLTQRMILPTDLTTELSTEDFIQGEKVRVAQLIREGRKLGVAVLLIGRVSKVVFRQRGDDIGLLRQKQSLAAVDLELKVFDVAGGREIMAVARSGEAASNAMVALDQSQIESPQYRADLTKLAMREAAARLVPDVVRAVEKLGWEGRIAKVAANKIYVNAGKASGLVVGDILRVLAPGDDVYDPATGAFLGRSQGQLKGTLEVVDFLGTDGAVTELHTGGNVLEGDIVQLY